MFSWRLLKIAGILLGLGCGCVAQVGQRPNAPTVVSLRMMVTVDGDAEKAANVTVELMDAFGSSGALDSKETDNSGNVMFRTLDGLHRIRITGPQIQTYEGEVRILPNETSHVERVRVNRVKGPHPSGESPGGGLVAAVRLNVPESARKDFEKGSEAMRQQLWPESLALFESAIAKYPPYDLAYDSRGFVQLQMNDRDAARQSFQKAIELNPDFAGAYRNLARLASIEHKYEEADSLLVKSLSTEPLNAWALVSAANAELLTHKYKDAIDHARTAHAVPHPGLAGVHFVAALALEATQQPGRALEEYRLYLQEDPYGRDAQRAEKAIERLGGTPYN